MHPYTGSPSKPLIFLSEACHAEQIFAPALLTDTFSTRRIEPAHWNRQPRPLSPALPGRYCSDSACNTAWLLLHTGLQAWSFQKCLWAKQFLSPRKGFTSTLQEPLPTLRTHLQLSHHWSARLAARALHSVGLPFTSWSYGNLPPFKWFHSRAASLNSSVLIWSCLLHVHSSWSALEHIFL